MRLPRIVVVTAAVTLAVSGVVVATGLPSYAAVRHHAIRLRPNSILRHEKARPEPGVRRSLAHADHRRATAARAASVGAATHVSVLIHGQGEVKFQTSHRANAFSSAAGRIKGGRENDTLAPKCDLLRIHQGLPTVVTVAVSDIGSGLDTVNVSRANTVVKLSHWAHGVTYNTFNPGYKGRLLIHLIKPKTAQYTPSTDTIVLHDMAGNVTTCNFYVFQVRNGEPVQRVRHVPHADHFAAIVNYGVRIFSFKINGGDHTFYMSTNEARLMDWGMYIRKPYNRVSVHGKGGRSWADVVLWDGDV
jgi:hypothetical protein